METTAKYDAVLKELLSKLPNLIVTDSRTNVLIAGRLRDLEIVVSNNGVQYELVVEVKSSGKPSAIKTAISSLSEFVVRGQPSRLYTVLAVPYVSEMGIQVCKDAGLGCVDLSGNCYLNFDSIYIETKGNPNPLPSTPRLSLFSPKSSRISRVILCNISKMWQVQSLAGEASVSMGLASRIKRELIEEGYIAEENRLLKLIAPTRLLEAWSNNYTYKRNKIKEYYSPLDSMSLEREIQTYCAKNNIMYALTLFSGASRVSPHVRINKSFIYVERGFADLEAVLGLKPSPSGSNLMLLEPYDRGVFYKPQNIGQDIVVSNVQLYLDLKRYKGRGDEAAEFLRKVNSEFQWMEN